MVFDTMHETVQVEVDWEGRDVLNRESLLSYLADEKVAEGHDSIFGSDLNLRTDTGTLKKH